MNEINRDGPWRVLIASSHPLFAKGLLSLLQKRQGADVVLVGMVSTIDEALNALKALHPDLVIVDYDDESVNREEFLARFVEGEGRLRVVLLSLKEGGSEAIVYDRRTMAASQIEDWLEKWTDMEAVPEEKDISGPEVGEVRNKLKRRDNMKHGIGAALMVVLLVAAGLIGLGRVNLLPEQASSQAQTIDGLFDLHFNVIVFLFAVIVGLMIYSILFFRRKRGDTTDAEYIEGSTPLEALWTLVPLGAVLYVSFLGAIVLGDIESVDPRPLEVEVIGSQWSWRFEYPEHGIISTELFLPVDKQSLLLLSSTDVIHSFWVPEFRVKQDALPGGDAMVRELRVTPSKTGDYRLLCAELCGRAHAEMVAPVTVLSQADFDAWVDSQVGEVSDDPVVRGEQWAQQFGCFACHTTDGSVEIGPSWQGIFGTQHALEDGTTVTVDEAYLYESIRDPGAKITAGFQNLMPANIAADMTDEQVNDVIAYIQSLK